MMEPLETYNGKEMIFLVLAYCSTVSYNILDLWRKTEIRPDY